MAVNGISILSSVSSTKKKPNGNTCRFSFFSNFSVFTILNILRTRPLVSPSKKKRISPAINSSSKLTPTYLSATDPRPYAVEEKKNSPEKRQKSFNCGRRFQNVLVSEFSAKPYVSSNFLFFEEICKHWG